MAQIRRPSSAGNNDFEPTNRPADFFPGDNHIICGKGTDVFNHIGNQRFRLTIAINIERYLTAPNRPSKSIVLADIVHSFGGSNFVRKDVVTNRWVGLDEAAVRDKVCQAIRLMSTKVHPVISNLNPGVPMQRQRLSAASAAKTKSNTSRTSTVPSQPRLTSLFKPCSRTPQSSSTLREKWALRTAGRKQVSNLVHGLTANSESLFESHRDSDSFVQQEGLDKTGNWVDGINPAIPPSMNRQASTDSFDWFDDDERDAGRADLSEFQIDENFFDTLALLA